MTGRTVQCGRVEAQGRLRKAEQFLASALDLVEIADDEREVADAVVALLFLAGIAASDVICCSSIGRRSRGQDHREAVSLLGSVRPDGPRLAKALTALLANKTRASYGFDPLPRAAVARARRRAEELVEAARTALAA